MNDFLNPEPEAYTSIFPVIIISTVALYLTKFQFLPYFRNRNWKRKINSKKSIEKKKCKHYKSKCELKYFEENSSKSTFYTMQPVRTESFTSENRSGSSNYFSEEKISNESDDYKDDKINRIRISGEIENSSSAEFSVINEVRIPAKARSEIGSHPRTITMARSLDLLDNSHSFHSDVVVGYSYNSKMSIDQISYMDKVLSWLKELDIGYLANQYDEQDFWK
ncbi:hypothetical protein SNEBB_006521 [Seison nebaliae]|nr:hypothetical protein SNEBB_006521 [Seison nebaliae]